jgi:uncharacterized protein
MRYRQHRTLGIIALAVTVAASALSVRAQDRALEGFAAVEELQIVDCLLPGQVRMVGGRPYITPRRPTRTTAADCGARGGEYLLYDRADYRVALNVWMPAAQDGDLEAQTIVGEIFERGLGAEPNYEAAAEWYRRAAERGYARAQFNLGWLYASGEGVQQDYVVALMWLTLAASQEDDIATMAANARDALATVMTSAAIAEAEGRVHEWRRK